MLNKLHESRVTNGVSFRTIFRTASRLSMLRKFWGNLSVLMCRNNNKETPMEVRALNKERDDKKLPKPIGDKENEEN